MSEPLPRIFVLVPGCLGGAAALVAAGRSGALGVLDLDRVDAATRRQALDEASRWADRPFAVRLDPGSIDQEEWPDLLSTVILTGDSRTEWSSLSGLIKRSSRRVIGEVTDRGSARAARSNGVDALILAGLEAGGRCAEDSSFILLQGVLADTEATFPIWVRGGIGLQSAPACVAVGAAGVVLDGAILLAKESPLTESDRKRIARLDGGETILLGPETGPVVRVDALPGCVAVARLRDSAHLGDGYWRQAIAESVGWAKGQARPIGQDAAFASRLASRHVTIGGIVQAISRAIDEGLTTARSARPLAPDSLMARSLGTRYPIVQGPMTRVSDSPAFAEAVARGGALPMLALAMLGGDEAAALLTETSERLGPLPWGVGVLGFVDPRLRAEQLAAIRKVHPPFALIAGGRTDQAAELEQIGIRTFLHAPSPGLLSQYLRDGARRFVLEGRECGGHVGPRSSLVLWEQAVAQLLDAITHNRIGDPSDLHVLFAGGVHNARSAAGVAALASPLADLGVKIGLLVGTAYVFTREAVDSGAITPRFQAEAVQCRSTVLLPTGPGHEVRAVPSPFTEQFARERKRMIESEVPADKVRESLERLNVGRLRVATKGVDRIGGAGSRLEPINEAEQYERGLYMIGQVATLRDETTTIAQIHSDLCEEDPQSLGVHSIEKITNEPPRPSDVAIVGMSAIMPGAGNVHKFWENTLKGVNAIIEVPPDRWDHRPYYDPDPKAPDKIISRWGGFVPDVPIDPLRYGMPPTSIPSIEPAQLLVLEAVRCALDDAGYTDRPFPKERTAVVLGMGGGAAQLAMGFAFRSYLPMLESVDPDLGRAIRDRAEPLLPAWTEDAFPGFLLNVTAGRVANRFDLGGANYTVDAACGSSLAAASLAVRELETGTADMVILGGADTVQNPFTYLAFSKTHAFSPRGRCRPFDASADGIVISEGVGVLVLKRLADAERDGDRIYAVIKGLGSSSDGRARGLTAPNGDGQTRALTRAYSKAGIRPSSVGYVEAHGTGTALGDVVEVNALSEFLRGDGAAPASCAIGSVKSMIGHTKCAAGLAGLINASLALYHKVLPPTIGVEQINPDADLTSGPLRVSTAARPWLPIEPNSPRRAGVSAFGFGGTNFHAVLEAYEMDPSPRPAPSREWPAELFPLRAENRHALLGMLDLLAVALNDGATPSLLDLSYTLIRKLDLKSTGQPTVAIVASTCEQLRASLVIAREAIARGDETLYDPRGIYFADQPAFSGAKVAFLFPGQGAQRLDMLLDLTLAFDEVRHGYESFDESLAASGRAPISSRIFPPPALDDAARERARLTLTAADAAQLAVGSASIGVRTLLETLGLQPDLVAGHSFGELVALHAAGVISRESLALLAEDRGTLIIEAAGNEPGVMTALACDATRTTRLIDGIDGVVLANINGPKQSVIAGHRDALNRAIDRARGDGVRVFDLPVGAAFHSPIVAGASEPLTALVSRLIVGPPSIPVFSNLDAQPHPIDRSEIARRMGDHLASPVQFSAMVEAMHLAGAQVFVECGPGSILSPLVSSILGDRQHLAVSIDRQGRPGIPTFLTALARLIVGGVTLDGLSRLTDRRGAQLLALDRLSTTAPELAPSTWLVNGSRARPVAGPEPRRLGMAPELIGITPPLDSSSPSRTSSSLLESTTTSVTNGHPSSLPPVPAVPRVPEPAASNAAIGPRSESKPLNHVHASNGSHFPSTDGTPRSTDGPRHAVGTDQVMESFQETMRAFLEVQRSTMLAYLTGRAQSPGTLPSSGSFDRRSSTPTSAPDSGESRLPHHGLDADYQPESPPIPTSSDSSHSHDPAANESNSVSLNGYHDSHVPVGNEATVSATKVEAPASPTSNSVSVAERLVEIVRERTGYPAEMLGMELDLEADLGIDSIKRVEILGTLRDSIDGLSVLNGSSVMDALTRAKSLGEIVNRVESALADQSSSSSSPVSCSDNTDTKVKVSSERPEPKINSVPDPLRRLILEAVEAPAPGPRTGLVPGGTILVTDDGRGVARSISDALKLDGLGVELVGPEWADLSSPASIAGRLAVLRDEGQLAGIIHAQPLGDPTPERLDPNLWNDRLHQSLRSLFLLARGAADDLERSAQQGGACLIAATSMGGTFASAGPPDGTFFPGQGGIAGLVKTLAREWPTVRTRVVDLDPRESPSVLASRLASEATLDDGWAEVGYRAGRRIRLKVVERPMIVRPPQIQIQPGEPILITGGARGISAAVAIELAQLWKPTLLLVGSSPLPPDVEESETAGIDSPTTLKSVLLDRLRRGQKEVGPSDLERAYRSLLHAREISQAIARMRDLGAEVDYARADVRDANALSRALNRWRSLHGDPVGMIHGAGVIHDKLLRDKTPESFERVLSTKINGALNLARFLNGDALRFSAFFSSVAGRFGNQGQSDYAAANEVLNKLAIHLDRIWPGRVVSINWGPWAGVGMVSDLQKHLGRRGLGMIDPRAGCRALVEELISGRKGEVEVILASDLGTLEGPLKLPESASVEAL